MPAVIPDLRRLLICVVLLLAAGRAPAAELRLTEGTNFSADISPHDGQVLIDLLGSVWLVPPRGGDARRLVESSWQASRPRWSPDGGSLLFESNASGRSLWRMPVVGDTPQRISPLGQSEQQGAWHPSGERVVFVAARDNSGLDIWERDLATGLAWRLTEHAGDESEPAWSIDGRHLVYVLHERDRWFLMLRRFGQSPQILHESATPLRAPAWRPDNTLITFLSRNEVGRLDLNMLIPATQPLVRVLASGEDFFYAPVAWRDRHQFAYTADGQIKTRRFAERVSRTLPFSAAVGQLRQSVERRDRARSMPAPAGKGGDLVVRTNRLFDGESAHYLEQVDVVIEAGVIVAIEAQRDRGAAVVIDIGGSTLLPGIIDAYAGLPADQAARLGPLLLAFGVTTLVTPDLTGAAARQLEDKRSAPGPRVLVAASAGQEPGERDDLRIRLATLAGKHHPTSHAADWRRRGVPVLADNWNAGLIDGADLLLGTATLPVSPAGLRYRDVQGLADGGPLLLVSGLADASTPGLQQLQQSSQGRSIVMDDLPGRRFGGANEWLNGNASVIVGSRPSGLPPGFATQSELLALHAAGLGNRDTLAAATSAAADALGVSDLVGRVRAGMRADLVLVAGDPLKNLADVGQVIAVIQNGHFYSAASLLDDYARLNVE